MFYSRLTALCAERGAKITNVVSELKMGSGNLSNWKAGRMPRGESLSKLADYFHVSTDYLLGRTDDPSPAGQKETPTPVPEDGPAKNVIKIAGRDGSFIERQLTDEQVAALKLIVDQLPDADDL